MMLSPREIDKMLIYSVADLAKKRKSRGLKLNYSEAVAVITEAILEGARDGKECCRFNAKREEGIKERRCHDACTRDDSFSTSRMYFS